MPRWSAAQQLSRIALKKPLQLTEWPDDMSGQILPAQLKLREANASLTYGVGWGLRDRRSRGLLICLVTRNLWDLRYSLRSTGR